MKFEKKEFYGSSGVVKELSISLRQLNYWVNKLHVVRPQLERCGHRFYRRFSREDLDQLKHMTSLVEKGYTPRAAAHLVCKETTNREFDNALTLEK